MGARDLAQYGDDPLAELVVGLAVLPAVTVLVPVEYAFWKALLDLRPGQALPLADVDLPQLAQRPDLGVQVRGDDLGGLARTREVAARRSSRSRRDAPAGAPSSHD